MEDETTGAQGALILRTDDGVWFKIPTADLTRYSMSEEEIAGVQQQVSGNADTQGFQAGGAGSGASYGWRELHYFLIGVEPSFTKYR